MPLVDQQQAAQHHVLTRHRDRAWVIQRIIRQVDNGDAFLRVRRRPVGTDVVVRRQTVLQFLHFLPIRFVALRVALLHLGASRLLPNRHSTATAASTAVVAIRNVSELTRFFPDDFLIYEKHLPFRVKPFHQDARAAENQSAQAYSLFLFAAQGRFSCLRKKSASKSVLIE